MKKEILITTNPGFPEERYSRVEKFVTTVSRGHGVPEWTWEDIGILVREILDRQDLDQMLSRTYEKEDFINALVVLESILQVQSQVLETLFPEKIIIRWIWTCRQTETPIINGEAYKEYWVKSKTKDKKYTRFLKLDGDKIVFSEVIEVPKNHIFNNEEILESFINI